MNPLRWPALVPAVVAVAVACAAAFVVAGPVPPFAGWQDGDLIFQQSRSSQSAAILAATNSRFTHMGIVSLRDGKAVVIEAGRTVSETPIAAFVARGQGSHYAIYRVRGLTLMQWQSVLAAARKLYGRPYDSFFRDGTDRIYCSELPRLAFAAAGIDLGTRERLGDLAVNNALVRRVFLSRWRQHPDCHGAHDNAETCWRRIQKQELVTPASIARDPDVTLVYSNF